MILNVTCCDVEMFGLCLLILMLNDVGDQACRMMARLCSKQIYPGWHEQQVWLFVRIKKPTSQTAETQYYYVLLLFVYLWFIMVYLLLTINSN